MAAFRGCLMATFAAFSYLAFHPPPLRLSQSHSISRQPLLRSLPSKNRYKMGGCGRKIGYPGRICFGRYWNAGKRRGAGRGGVHATLSDPTIIHMSNPFPDTHIDSPYVKFGNIVQVLYTSYTKDGNVHDTNHGSTPLEFKVGSKQVLSVFEYGVRGLQVGQTRRIKFNCTNMFPYDPALVMYINEKDMPEGVREGLWIELESGAKGKVVSVEHNFATVDFNSPLADVDVLDFDIRLVRIVDPIDRPPLTFHSDIDNDETLEERERHIQTIVNYLEGLRLSIRGVEPERIPDRALNPDYRKGQDIVRELTPDMLANDLDLDLNSESSPIRMRDPLTDKIYTPDPQLFGEAYL